MPGDTRRADQLLAFREGVPSGVNRRVGEAKRDVDHRIEKSAADMIVPFEQFGAMLDIYRDGYRRRGLWAIPAKLPEIPGRRPGPQTPALRSGEPSASPPRHG
jgi:hypothetical protein